MSGLSVVPSYSFRYMSPIIRGISISKAVGFLLGIILFLATPHFVENYSEFNRWGILFWYPTVAGITGASAAFDKEPMFGWRLSWWFRGIFCGAWMHLMLVLFAADAISDFAMTVHLSAGSLSSPFWFVADGVFAGLIFALIVDQFQKKENE